MSFFSNFFRFVGRYQRSFTLILLLSVSSIMLLVSGTLGPTGMQLVGFSVVSFFESSIDNVGKWASKTISSIDELRKTSQELEVAKKTLAEYSGLQRKLVNLDLENRSLREQLQYSKQIDFANVPAQVIGHDPTNFFSTFLVNKGYFDGIRNDMAVVAFQDGLFGLVGRVKEVGANSCIVIPIIDPGVFVSARFQVARFEGLVSGKGTNDEKLVMQYVRRSAHSEIKKDDWIVTTGFNSLFPLGIFIGRVSSYSMRDFDTSLEIELQPAINFSKLEYVFVIKGEKGG